MGVCDRCAKPLTGQRRRWCSNQCKHRHHVARTATRRGNRLTDAKVAEVKQQYPSCDRDWDADMVDRAARKDMLLIIARKLERYDARKAA